MGRAQGRRGFLALLGSGATALAGCASESSPDGRETIETPSDAPSGARIPTATATSREFPETVFVDAETGSTSGSGSRDDPVESFRHAVKLVEPGQTIYADPGEYNEWVFPEHGGERGAPITITGPPDAVVRSDERRFQPMQIRDSHVHVTGLTLDGLWDPSSPEDPESYAHAPLVEVKPRDDTDDYLEDVVVAPHGIGNSYAALVVAQRTKDSEIGPFEVTGLAGANYVLNREEDRHVGEIVYLGTPPSSYAKKKYPWDALDETRNILVHHVDNSAGHPHSELVNTKLGTHDIVVEYCTDGGGSQNTDTFPAASVRFQSYDATLRWCDLRDGEEAGVWIDGGGAGWLADRYDQPPVDPDQIGRGHTVYGNRIEGFGGRQVALKYADLEDQTICGNDVAGATMADPESPCPSDLPEGDGIGYQGGDAGRS